MPEQLGVGKLMTVPEAAEFFGVSVHTIRKWCSLRNGRRRLANYKVEKKITISTNCADRLLRESERPQLQHVA